MSTAFSQLAYSFAFLAKTRIEKGEIPEKGPREIPENKNDVFFSCDKEAGGARIQRKKVTRIGDYASYSLHGESEKEMNIHTHVHTPMVSSKKSDWEVKKKAKADGKKCENK